MAGEKETPAALMTRLLKDRLVPRMVSEGAFGKDWRLQSVEVEPVGGLGEDHWTSITMSVTLHLAESNSNAKKRSRSVALVTKCMAENVGVEGYSLPELLAANEVASYNKIFPFLERLGEGCGLSISDLHPKCFLAKTKIEGLLSITAMEDLRADGYFLAKKRTELDKDHVMVALRAIGRYHAFSYAAKARCRKEFMETMVPLLREAMFTQTWDDTWSSKASLTMKRGLDRAEGRLENAKDEDKDRHQRRLERFARFRAIAKNPFPSMQACMSPTEPASVIVHGDFCRNNMSFHYGDDGVPDRVCLFDFQTTRYCSPTVDLSFFLFLNTSAALRAELWDDLFREYFNSLKNTLDRLLDGHAVDRDFVMPTLQGAHEDFRRNAMLAYVICSYFLPEMMMRREDIIPLEEMKERWRNDEEATMKFVLNMSGERGTEALADIVMDFLDRDLVP